MTETQQQPSEVTEKNLPSLDLIYHLANESYGDITARMKTQDERIRHIATLALTITAAVPAAYQIFGISPNLIFLGVAGILALSCLTLCTVATAKNTLIIRSVNTMFEHYLQIPEYQAKVSLIKYAGEDQMENIRYHDSRDKLLVYAMAFLSAEIILLALSGLFGS